VRSMIAAIRMAAVMADARAPASVTIASAR